MNYCSGYLRRAGYPTKHLFKRFCFCRSGRPGLKQRRENLLFLTELYPAGAIHSVIDRCYPLEEIVAVHRYVETGRKAGAVVIAVA